MIYLFLISKINIPKLFIMLEYLIMSTLKLKEIAFQGI